MQSIRIKSQHVVPAALLSLFAFMCLWNLNHYYFWEDEGETVYFAKSILHHGIPLGFDGRNLYEQRGGIDLNFHYVNVFYSWLPCYLTAGSFAIFGFNHFAGRLPFVLCGIAAVWMAYIIALRYYQNRRTAIIALLLMATNIQFILFARQSRHYMLVTFLAMLVFWLYLGYDARTKKTLAAGGLFILFFFAHHAIGFVYLSTLFIVFCFMDDWKKAVRFFIYPAPAVMAVVIPYVWWLFKDGSPANPYYFRNLVPENFLRISWNYFRDYNFTNLLPVGVLAAFASYGAFARFRPLKRSPYPLTLDATIVLIIALFTIGMSAISFQTANGDIGEIRYATAVMPFMFLVEASFFSRIWLLNRSLAIVLIAVSIGSNLLTFNKPEFYLYEFIQENAHPFPTATQAVVEELQKNAKQDETIVISPNYRLGCMLYYLGDKLRFCGVISLDNKNILPHHPDLPKYIYSPDEKPDWIILFGWDNPTGETFLKDYILRQNLSRDYIRYNLPFDGRDMSRPEIYWRTFKPIPKENIEPLWKVCIFHRKQHSTRQ